MSRVKKLLGFRTKNEEVDTELADWDIYPTHLIIPDGYWSTSSEIIEENKEQ